MAAALCNGRNLPPALKIRPGRSGAGRLADRSGLAVLEAAGVIEDGTVDPDVASWVAALGRPELEIDVIASRPEEHSDQLLGPPPMFVAPDDASEAAAALARWYAERPPQRVVALCRRDGVWVGAARLWRPGDDGCDDIVISPLGSAPISEAIVEVLGPAQSARFHGINSEAAVLNSALTAWQANPVGHDLVADLVGVGLTVRRPGLSKPSPTGARPAPLSLRPNSPSTEPSWPPRQSLSPTRSWAAWWSATSSALMADSGPRCCQAPLMRSRAQCVSCSKAFPVGVIGRPTNGHEIRYAQSWCA